MICRGKSPGTAANLAISSGLVDSERAKIVLVPEIYAQVLAPYTNKLLNEEEAEKAGALTGVPMIRE